MNIRIELKRIVSLLLVSSIALTSCHSVSVNQASDSNVIIDAANNKLSIKENAETLMAASVYAVAVPFFSALKMTDRVKAVNTKSKFWKEVDEHLEKADTVGKGTVDLEKLAKINPSCLVHRSNDKKTVDAVKKLGIDVLCIRVESVEDVIYTLDIMGKYFGREKEAQEVIEYIRNKFDKIDNIVKNIKEEEKKTAIVMGGTLGRVAGSDMLQSFMINKAGGVCKVLEKKDSNWVDIGVEKIFEYNPDYIFLTSSTSLDYDEEELLNSSTWSAMKAVKDNKIFKIPSKMDSWDMPGISCVIGTMYMLYKMYPEYFSKEELQEEIDEYYNLMFGKTFDKNYLGYTLE
ncbi:MAG: ABC transporter substrate-binding protein [Lachnospiraceae bacterium]|nr:ABC transporter substrate-binding protein [Lachnospiraceae bacterium]